MSLIGSPCSPSVERDGSLPSLKIILYDLWRDVASTRRDRSGSECGRSGSHHCVVPDDFPKPLGAQFGDSLLGLEVDVVDAEALLETVRPFKVVEQAPQEVALE